jgi:hypothetical protein
MAATIAGSGILGFFGGLLSPSSVVVVDSGGFFAATGGGIGVVVGAVVAVDAIETDISISRCVFAPQLIT